jgi:hypothetical protein
MNHCSSLIQAYRASGGDPSVVSQWWECYSPPADQLVAVSEEIGALFLAGQLAYPLASGLMSQLMPLAGWEQPPQRFWQYYVAFEDAETLAEPDPQARLAVQAVANTGAA